MSSAAPKNPLLQLFRRKLQIAVQLTQDDYRREAKQGDDHAAILARMRPLVEAHFKPVAQIASQLIAAGFAWEVEEVHGTTGWVISDLRTNPYPVNALHEIEFQDMFTDVWCRLVLEAELEAPWHGSESESAGAVDEDDSAAQRLRRTHQIGDRVVSRLPPRSGTPAPAPEPPASILEPRLPGDEVSERAVAQETGADELSKRLQRGKDCEEMVMEIRKIKSDVREHGMTIFQSREAHPEFRIWNLVDHLPDEDKRTFNKPDEWGPVRGYANRLLARHYGVEPSTVDDSRKEWRAHEKSPIQKTSS